MLMTGCTDSFTPDQKPIPDTLAQCTDLREDSSLIAPQSATQADIGGALIALYAGWEDCFLTVQRLRPLLDAEKANAP